MCTRKALLFKHVQVSHQSHYYNMYTFSYEYRESYQSLYILLLLKIKDSLTVQIAVCLIVFKVTRLLIMGCHIPCSEENIEPEWNRVEQRIEHGWTKIKYV